MKRPQPIPCGKVHKRVIQDPFLKSPGYKRTVQGDCYCVECKQPVVAWWNDGKMTPTTE